MAQEKINNNKNILVEHPSKLIKKFSVCCPFLDRPEATKVSLSSSQRTPSVGLSLDASNEMSAVPLVLPSARRHRRHV